MFIADQLAALNFEVHEELTKRGDHTAGPRCIVTWSRRRDSRRGRPAGGQVSYSGTSRDRDVPRIPDIVNGTDATALCEVLLDLYHPVFTEAGVDPDTNKLDRDEANRRLAALPTTPDDKLR